MAVRHILVEALAEFGHASVDLWVRPAKVLFPQLIEWWRWDKGRGFIRDVKPAGYWIGHIVAYVLLLISIIWAVSNAVPAEYFQ